ncbi:hypothetical protein [Methanosarcina sp.]|nr:hypothetical protein [Methanosarcina sp.]MDY9925450.1 hypothetical protein [Methanosarcina sp.]
MTHHTLYIRSGKRSLQKDIVVRGTLKDLEKVQGQEVKQGV